MTSFMDKTELSTQDFWEMANIDSASYPTACPETVTDAEHPSFQNTSSSEK